MAKKKRIKYISPQMKFNPGRMNFEPDLPIQKSIKKKARINWGWLIVISIALLLMISIMIYISIKP